MVSEFATRVALLVLFLSLLLGTAFALYFQDRRNTLNRLLALQLILIAIWQYTGFLHALLSAGPPLVRPLQIVAGVVAAYVFFVVWYLNV